MEPVRATNQAGTAPKTFGEKRTCPDCGCRLSRYNPEETCSACTPPDRHMMRMTGRRGRRPKDDPEDRLEATG